MATLKANVRAKLGTRHTRLVRATGMVPGVIYGHGLEPVPFAVGARELEIALKHGDRLVQMEIEGKTENYLIKAVQHDAFGSELIHVDLARVSLDETVEVTVPVVLRGTPVGVADGGVLVPGLAELEIECLVTKIPEDIRVKVNDMKIGDVIRVKDLPPMEGVKVLSDEDASVASVSMVAEEVAAPAVEGEEGAEPEIIAKGKKEEEGETPEA